MGKTWTDVQLSAYLDAQLPEAERAALEADLARDTTLQEQVAALQHTVALMQALPLREPPRNYLLTPAMVADPTPPQPARARRRSLLPLWLMRVATVVSAAAFVLAVGLNLAGLPMATAPTAPAPQALLDTEALTLQEVASEATLETAKTRAMNSALPPVEEPAPEFGSGSFEEGFTGTLEADGIGGAEPEMGIAAAPFPAPKALPEVGLCAADSAEDCPDTAAAAATFTTTEVLPEAEMGTAETLPSEMARLPMTEEAVSPQLTAAPLPTPSTVPPWLVALLGVSTVGLAWGTWVLSRRR